MKICHAFIFFSIRFAGGTSDLMYKICKAQVKQGHAPVVYSGDYRFDHDLAHTLPGVGFCVEKSWLDKAGFSIMPGLPALLQKEIKSFDIVHMHAFRTFQNIMLYIYCRKFGVPYVIDAHGAVPLYKRKNLLKKFFDRFWGLRMLRDAEFLVAETEVGVQEYLAVDPTIDRNRIVIISPPFDTDEFTSLPERGAFRRAHKIPEDKKVVMFLGRVHHIKGNDFLIEGFADLVRRRNDVLLLIVGGDDGHMEECKALAQKLGVGDRVIFTGFIGGHQKNEALVDADVVAQLSRHEQGAWAPFEAVLCGTPILVTSHTGAGEDVRRVDAGDTVEFGNVADLSQKIEAILDNYTEAKERTMKAKAFIESKMSMNARAREYIDLYQRAISQSSAKACGG